MLRLVTLAPQRTSSRCPAQHKCCLPFCVAVRAPQDAEDVQRVCRGLQRAVPPGLLQDKRLLFKPDIYTHLGIYSRNEWGIKPSTQEARLP